MGNVIPDRFFWALPEEGEEEGAEPGDAEPGEGDAAVSPRNPRHVH
jgi:hydroxymethylpyrimidine/phosphomethylpyrimidine kinase